MQAKWVNGLKTSRERIRELVVEHLKKKTPPSFSWDTSKIPLKPKNEYAQTESRKVVKQEEIKRREDDSSYLHNLTNNSYSSSSSYTPSVDSPSISSDSYSGGGGDYSGSGSSGDW